MTDEALLRLALQACHDPVAQPVLGDAVLEADWYDERVMHLVIGHRRVWWARNGWPDRHLQTTPAKLRTRFLRRASKPDRKWCRAVAAVLLCSDWQTVPWPVWKRSALDDLWASASPGAWLGVNRTPEARLRGITILQDGSIITTEQARQLMELPETMSPRERVLEAARRAAEQVPERNPLADVWERELEGMWDRYDRDVLEPLVRRWRAS